VDAQLAVKRSELLSFLLSSIAGVVSVAALNIRNLDETVKRRLQVRAARHGRSMEAEVRAILAEAVREPADSAGLFTTLLDRFGALGGVDLDLPGREEPARAAEFSA
jgi:plasmid stability protein